MSFSAMSIPSILSGSGLEAMESRMQQIESMLNTRPAVSAPDTASPVRPQATTTAQPTNTPQPFQFYLQKAGVANLTPSSANSASGFANLQPLVAEVSQRYQLDKNLLNAIIQQESGFNPAAVSKAGATGLMQLMPGTAQHLGVANPADPAQNLDGGARYLKSLLSQFNGNLPLALAAYNAGPNAVKKHQGIPPFQETQQYVRNILANYLKSRQPTDANS